MSILLTDKIKPAGAFKQVDAVDVEVDAALFAGNLSIADTNLQLALATINSLTLGVATTNNWTAANNSIDFITAPSAIFDRAIALGDNSISATIEALSIGTNSYAEGFGNIAIGAQATALGDLTLDVNNNLAIGSDSMASGDASSTAIGDLATASGLNSTALGAFSTAQGANAVAIGQVNASLDNEVKLGIAEVNEISFLAGVISAYGNNSTELAYTYGTYYKDNTGAIALTTLALPAATVGLKYVIERVASFTYQVDPNLTDYFTGSSAGLYKSLDTDGAYISIECFKTGIWHVVASLGTITDQI